MPSTHYYVGLLSGTSMDGVDAAIVEFTAHSYSIIHHYCAPIPQSLQVATLQLITATTPCSLYQLGGLDAQWGELLGKVTLELMAQAQLNPSQIIALGSHGQTICHAPSAAVPFSLQIGDPNRIAKQTRLPTVADFRRSDLALNGQGAPLAPLFHQWLFQHPTTHRVVVNLGGMANITLLPKQLNTAIVGYDTGPANALLDAWCQQHQGMPFDDQGQWSRQGMAHPGLLVSCLQDRYFQQNFPKSTGKEYFNLLWLNQKLTHWPDLTPVEVQATLVQLTAITIAQAIKQHFNEAQVILAGGGAYNTALIEQLQQQLGTNYPLLSSQTWGYEPNWIEAALFAWLAQCRIEQRPLALQSITGATHSQILGGLYLP